MTLVGDTLTLTFTTTPGLRYQVETSDDLTAWTPVASGQVATGATFSVQDTGSTGRRRFFGVRVTR